MHGIFLDYATVGFNDDLDPASLRRALPQLELRPQTAQSAVAGIIAGADVVLVNKLRITREIIERTPTLRLIALAATGTDNIDLDAARARSVAVCNLRDYCTASVVQHVMGTLLLLTQQLREYDALVRSGAWPARRTVLSARLPDPRPDRPQSSASSASAHSAKPWHAPHRLSASRCCWPTARADAGRGRLDLDDLLPQVDVLSLHCPLSPATQGLIGAPQLARMKPDAVLINTARGALVDSAALAAALRAGRLGGAAIDVLPQEPPVDGNPLLAGDIPHLIVTPHVAWAAREARQRCLDEMAANVEDFRRGGRRGRVV